MFEIVTSFRAEDYFTYGDKMVQSVLQHLPDVNLTVCFHDGEIPKYDKPNLKYINLDVFPLHKEWYEKNTSPLVKGQTPQGYNYRYDAHKFTHKVMALAAALMDREDQRYVIWLDGDTEIKEPVDLSQYVLENGISYLDRKDINYAETSFIGFHVPAAIPFLEQFIGTFVSGEFSNYVEWHDGFIFSRLIRLHEGLGLKTRNLSEGVEGLEAFKHAFGEKMTHYKGPKKMAGGSGEIIVQPKDCVAADVIIGHIHENEKEIDKWIAQAKRNNTPVIAISAGPSLDENIGQIKELIAEMQYAGRSPVIFTVKHAYPKLLNYGIIPHVCLLLDPREFEGYSTIGVYRKSLLENPHPMTTFMCATMVHPSTIKFLKDKGAKIVGWDAWTNGVVNHKLPEGRFYITGGTCSAMRIVGVGHVLGFREYHLFGYDFCWQEKPGEGVDEKGRPKYMKVGLKQNPEKNYWTTGEFIAGAQDFERLMAEINGGKMDIDIYAYGEGMVPDIWQVMRQPERPNWSDII